MRIRHRAAAWSWLLALLLLPATSAAQQTTVDQWRGLRVSDLQTLYVLEQSGTETTGKMVRLEPDAIVLLVDGAERRLDRESIARIQRRDSLRNGAVIGAAVGAGLGAVSAGISDCPGRAPGGSCPGFRGVLLVSSVGIYSALGTAIDALIPGRTTLWVGPSDRGRANVPVTAGLRVTVTW
jgi:hypothetical protein